MPLSLGNGTNFNRGTITYYITSSLFASRFWRAYYVNITVVAYLPTIIMRWWYNGNGAIVVKFIFIFDHNDFLFMYNFTILQETPILVILQYFGLKFRTYHFQHNRSITVSTYRFYKKLHESFLYFNQILIGRSCFGPCL